jgi:hypothetical protein
MKLFTLILAGLVAVAANAPATASAQMQSSQERHDKRVVTTKTVVRTDNDRHEDARPGNRHGWRDRHHTRRVCRNEWRHHHRVRICRTVRW